MYIFSCYIIYTHTHYSLALASNVLGILSQIRLEANCNPYIDHWVETFTSVTSFGLWLGMWLLTLWNGGFADHMSRNHHILHQNDQGIWLIWQTNNRNLHESSFAVSGRQIKKGHSGLNSWHPFVFQVSCVLQHAFTWSCFLGSLFCGHELWWVYEMKRTIISLSV